MKFVGIQLAYYLRDKQVRRNARTLLKYLAFLGLVIVIYAIVFQIIMLRVEGQEHSWLTGFYWTLTVMSTLGFGDITFHSDLGRMFSIIVLLSGIVLLLIVLPFAFIRYFYAPLLESRIRNQAPRMVARGTEGHVIICSYDAIAEELIRRLHSEAIPYFIVEADPAQAANWHLDGISVIAGDVDGEDTYRALSIDKARLVLVNREDTMNTKIILTIRHIHPDVPIVAVANEEDSVDILQLSGANQVLSLKSNLGEQLANRASAQHAKSHPIGRYEDLLIAELPIHNTPLVNKTVRESGLRQLSGTSIIGLWERGHMLPARGSMILNDATVLVLIGNKNQLRRLDELFVNYDVNPNPVVVIGGGRVGGAASEALQRNGIKVNVIERDRDLCKRIEDSCDRVFGGDAADYKLLKRAGIMEAPSVLLTTNDDAMNIYLASYCRKLNKELRIISRITEARNIELIHRAGTDFVLSYASLGAEAVFSILQRKQLTILGEGVNLFTVPVSSFLDGKTLAESEIGARTGLTVIAIKEDGRVSTQLSTSTPLSHGSELVMLGDSEQRQKFAKLFRESTT
ncbi:MAG: NAD-binding protein [Saprospiraceae bacterium]|nr:NAD-binding protein [Saprospiraceae bacterium]